MPGRHKILLLDDEEDLLEMYREIFSNLPSRPEIHTSNTGARAIALLESQPFSLLISDLNMPKMDGLQVLSIVRRKFPELRLVVLTAVMDEQYRSRAYAMGVDLFWQKPATDEEIKLFTECVEALLDRDSGGGFRGVQSKGLMDIIQLECLSQSSSVLKLTNGAREGKIWVLNGEIVDAVTGALNGEAAFKEIASWRTGAFETFPPEPGHPRNIHVAYQSLLLDSAQAFDEARDPEQKAAADPDGKTKLQAMAECRGVDFVLSMGVGTEKAQVWGLENETEVAEWSRRTFNGLQKLGNVLKVGDLTDCVAAGSQSHLGLSLVKDDLICVGFKRSLTLEQVRENLKSMMIKWVS